MNENFFDNKINQLVNQVKLRVKPKLRSAYFLLDKLIESDPIQATTMCFPHNNDSLISWFTLFNQITCNMKSYPIESSLKK